MSTPNISSTSPSKPPSATPEPSSIPTAPFTILPLIHSLLTRLLPADSSTSTSSTQTQPPLSPKSVPPETAKIRQRIQAARALVDSLPDIQRTVEEQEGEIRRLEEVVKRRKEVLGRLGTAAGGELKEGVGRELVDEEDMEMDTGE